MPKLAKLPLNVVDVRADVRNSTSSSTFRIGVRAEVDSVDIMIHGVIGDDWQGLDSGSIAGFLKDHKGKTVNIDINSGGGLAFDGVSIYNALVMHGAPVNVDITGMAASAASIIAMAGDRIRIAENGTFLPHRAWGITVGNCKALRDTADFLEKLDGQIAATYAARTGRKAETMLKLMDGAIDGTAFSGPEAVENGFADEVIPLKKKTKDGAASNLSTVTLTEAAAALGVTDTTNGAAKDLVVATATTAELIGQFTAEAQQREADAVKVRLGLLKLDEAA